MAEPETRTCTDCQGTMGEITLLDKGHRDRGLPVEYAASDAKSSFFVGIAPPAGRVKGFMCADCGLIKLYGVPRS